MMKKSEGDMIIYRSADQADIQIEVRVEDETVWLTQAQMVELFDSTKQNISLHINNIYKEGELYKEATVKDYLTVQYEGGLSQIMRPLNEKDPRKSAVSESSACYFGRE